MVFPSDRAASHISYFAVKGECDNLRRYQKFFVCFHLFFVSFQMCIKPKTWTLYARSYISSFVCGNSQTSEYTRNPFLGTVVGTSVKIPFLKIKNINKRRSWMFPENCRTGKKLTTLVTRSLS